LNAKINYLKGRLDECEGREPNVVERERVVERTLTVATPSQWVVQFAQGSSDLTAEAKQVLNGVNENTSVNVVGTASPEGTAEFNDKLSEKRANVVAEYLKSRGVKVVKVAGEGVNNGDASNRLVFVTLAQ
jgi:outer membrane protein OmpA-like peptidoglycan-associated protein